MSNNAEYLLSEEAILQLKKPYFSMTEEEKVQLTKLRIIYRNLTVREKNFLSKC